MDQSKSEHVKVRGQWRKYPLWLGFFAAVIAIVIALRPAEKPSIVDKMFTAMAKAGNSYDPAPLVELGQPGLKAALEKALPFVLDANIESGDEDIEIIQEMEIGKWLAWGTGDLRRADAPTSHVDGFVVYLKHVDDDESIRLITNRVLAVLKEGTLRSSARKTILKHCVVSIVRSGNELQIKRLTDLFNTGGNQGDSRGSYHGNRAASWLVELACHGDYRGFAEDGELDELVVAALRSDNSRVVDEALGYCTDIRRNDLAAELKTALTDLFQGENEELKFHSCFPLMYLFSDRVAVDYLMEQTGSPDKERARTAIQWLGDTCNWGKPASPALLEAMLAKLRSENVEVRLAACEAIGTYSGEEVIRLLIAMLDDNYGNIVLSAQRDLQGTLAKRNKALRPLLEEAAVNSDSQLIQERSRALLDKLKGQ